MGKNRLIENKTENKIYLMNKGNKNFGRYNKGKILLDIENQKSHYRYLLEPRKSMRISQQSSRLRSLSTNNRKFEKTQILLRENQNKRLYKVLVGIQASKGTIELMEEKAQEEQRNRNNKRHSLVNEFRVNEWKNQVKKSNKRIVQMISQAKPKIGNLSEWEQHYCNFQKNKKMLSRATQHIFNFQSIIKQQRSKQLNKQSLDFHRSSRTSSQAKRVKKMGKFKKSKQEREHNEAKKKEQKQNFSQGLNEQEIRIIKQQGKKTQQDQRYVPAANNQNHLTRGS